MSKLHKDCPLTRDQIMAAKADLYLINSTNKCCNPPSMEWYKGVMYMEEKRMDEEHTSAYKQWLESELARL